MIKHESMWADYQKTRPDSEADWLELHWRCLRRRSCFFAGQSANNFRHAFQSLHQSFLAVQQLPGTFAKVAMVRVRKYLASPQIITPRASVAPSNARPQRQAPNRCPSGSAVAAIGAASAAGRWLGPGPRALLATPSRVIPVVAASFVTLRTLV